MQFHQMSVHTSTKQFVEQLPVIHVVERFTCVKEAYEYRTSISLLRK